MNDAANNSINRKEHSMKPFARIDLSSAALRRGILVSSLAREGNNGEI